VHNEGEVVPGSGIHLAIEDRIATVTIARSEVGNTMTSAAFDGLADAFALVEANSAVAALVLRSDGEVFCSGGSYLDPGEPSRPSMRYAPRLAECYDRWISRSFPAAVIVNGAARAFGCAIALTADVIVATPRASFQLPEMLGGVVPSFAIATLLTQHSAGFVGKLALGCRPLAAAEALAQGLVSHLVDTLDDAELALAAYLQQWRAVDPTTLRAARSALTGMAATDDAGRRALAIAGVEQQLARFSAGVANQDYLLHP
jgi:enoyl-CoA hydratase/carnithine racemase